MYKVLKFSATWCAPCKKSTNDIETNGWPFENIELTHYDVENNDEVVDAISFANRRNQILNPTSSLAFEVLDAYEKLAPSTGVADNSVSSLVLNEISAFFSTGCPSTVILP